MKVKMIKYLHKALGLFASVAILLLTACSAFTGSHNNTKEYASIRICVNDIERAVLPYIEKEDFSSLKLVWTDSDNNTYTKQWVPDESLNQSAYQVMNNDIFTLPIGTYTFVLTAMELYGAIYKARLENQVVTADSTLNFNLELSALAQASTSNRGSIDLKINYPLENVKKILITRYNTLDENNYKMSSGTEVLAMSYISGEISLQQTLEAGSYIFEFLFYGGESYDKADVLLGKWIEYVYISFSRTSKAEISIDSLDNIYTITYNNAEEAAFSTMPLYFTSRSNITLPEIEKEGYNFEGWYTSTDGGQTLSNTPVSGWNAGERTESITLYAKWSRIRNTVSYYTNLFSDDVDEAYGSPVEIMYGDTITAPAAPTKEGYNFVYWTKAGTAGTAFDFDNTVITCNTVLYAVWSYDVSFNANGGTGTMEAEPIYSCKDWRSLPNLPANTFEREGYSFLGWADSAEKTQVDYADGYAVNSSENWEDNAITLYAVWHDDSNGYVINFDSNGGSILNAQIVAPGQKAVEPEEPENNSHSFVGWFTSEDEGASLSESPYDFENTEVTSNLTLYAKWIKTTYYVSENGDDTAGDGSEVNPYASITSALNSIKTKGNGNFAFQIKVSGEIKENILIGTDFTSDNAASLLLCGITGCNSDILNGDKNGSVLTITTTVPVTLQDITITNGEITEVNKGAGITIFNSHATVYIGRNAIITNNKNNYSGKSCSGGVLVRSGNLYIEEAAKITQNESRCSGGGLCIHEESGRVIMNGGEISYNVSYTSDNINYYGGGGVFIDDNSTFIMNGGSISNNRANGNGGGVFVSSNAYFTITGGEICNNTAAINGAGIYNKAGYAIGNISKTRIEGGVIRGNIAAANGGGIYNYENANLFMSGGTICNNTAAKNGGAVYNLNNGKFHMSGSAYIPAGEDQKNLVYLVSDNNRSYISIDGELGPAEQNSDWSIPIATITPKTYDASKHVLRAENDLAIQDFIDLFVITPYKGVDILITPDINKPTYACLNIPVYNIAYRDKGNRGFSGSFTTNPDSTYTLALEEELPVPTKEGYIFNGWYTSVDCTGNAVTSFEELIGDVNLYAWWLQPVINITINSGDISISQSENENTITLTAANGFTDYTWLVDGSDAIEVISGSSISEDGKSFTFNKESLLEDYLYLVRLVANNAYGVPCSTSITIQK